MEITGFRGRRGEPPLLTANMTRSHRERPDVIRFNEERPYRISKDSGRERRCLPELSHELTLGGIKSPVGAAVIPT